MEHSPAIFLRFRLLSETLFWKLGLFPSRGIQGLTQMDPREEPILGTASFTDYEVLHPMTKNDPVEKCLKMEEVNSFQRC
jgi:hypothetical protein